MTNKELVKKAVEAHCDRGSSGLEGLKRRIPEAREAVQRVRDYIAENFGTGPHERCWPGELAREPHYTALAKYAA